MSLGLVRAVSLMGTAGGGYCAKLLLASRSIMAQNIKINTGRGGGGSDKITSLEIQGRVTHYVLT